MHDHQLIYITKRGFKKTLYTLGNLYLFNFSYSHLLLIRWGASQVLFIIYLFISQQANLIGPLLKKKFKKSNYGGSILKYWVPPLWPTYIGDRTTRFAKAYGIKSEVLWRTCWGTHWELGGHVGTHWELIGNIVGTQWEPRKNGGKKKSFPDPKLKRKKKV
jgi:hypothetical protein